ncbi:unnamed protein product [Rotaria sordida]|uniref:Uncharacterized protein n=1 Tax=Rotaria sordida TaxID=392033 RepID=A0A814B703_9BILA|nr:unnamed protein product [Rotaria sordida]CAF3898729.1 unnamed protein product [Rotaria sordida]
MKKNQLKLNEIWSKNKILSEGIHSTVDNEIEILSTTSSSSSSIPSTSISTPLSSSIAFSSSTDLCPLLIPIEVEELLLEIDTIHKNSSNDTLSSLPDHDYTSSHGDKNIDKKNLTSQPKRRIQYLTEDDLKSCHSCWSSSDNAFTFTGTILGAYEGVIARLRDYLTTDCLEMNALVAHSISLISSQSCYVPKT